jgi:hypothetical protein
MTTRGWVLPDSALFVCGVFKRQTLLRPFEHNSNIWSSKLQHDSNLSFFDSGASDMKRIFTAFSLCVCVTTVSFAQTSLTIGGGLNSSFSDNEDAGAIEYSNRLGYNLGVGLQFRRVPAMSFALEANLETRGETIRYSNGTQAPGEIFVKLQYLQVPAFWMLHIPARTMTVDLFAGPVLGIPVSGEVESPGFVLGGGGGDTPPFTYPAGKWKIEDLEMQFGVEVGLGLSVPWRAVSIFVRPSYYHGFTNKISEKGVNMDDRQRNIKLKAGLQLPL